MTAGTDARRENAARKTKLPRARGRDRVQIQMNACFDNRAGFTLIEVLVALGLCALLATAAASATAFAARTERAAARDGEASFLLPALYAAQRLRPDELPAAPPGWRVETATDIVKLSDDLLQEWRVVGIRTDDRLLPPFAIRILDETP